VGPPVPLEHYSKAWSGADPVRRNRECFQIFGVEMNRGEKQRLKVPTSQSFFETERVWSWDHTLSVWRRVS